MLSNDYQMTRGGARQTRRSLAVASGLITGKVSPFPITRSPDPGDHPISRFFDLPD